jgi:hypothetical protein
MRFFPELRKCNARIRELCLTAAVEALKTTLAGLAAEPAAAECSDTVNR